jgi:exodeoxyribonuclease VII large subunit
MTLFDLHEHVRRVVALNYREPVWITAEVSQSNRSRGHWYLDLIEKGDTEAATDGIVAQASAIVWAKDMMAMVREHGPVVERVLQAGSALKCRVRLDFHERYGLKLHIVDVDPTYTLGQLARERAQNLETLAREGLLDLNRALVLPIVCQRVAIISSTDAAGYQDFINQLTTNSFSYEFRLSLWPVAVQGQNAPAEIVAALEEAGQTSNAFDAIVLVRGGGARLDLAAFDQLAVAAAVARCPIPVLAGIGHHTDDTLVDRVAHTSLKTPTAVADFLVERSLDFEQMLLQSGEALRRIGALQLQIHRNQLEKTQITIQQAAHWQLRAATARLDQAELALPQLAKMTINRAHQTLDQAASICAVWHPDAALRRGYSLTLHNGKVVRSASALQSGDVVTTRLADGEVRSTID